MPEIGQDVREFRFTENGDPEGPPTSVNTILFGIDLTDFGRDQAMRFELVKRGEDPDSLPPFDHNSQVQPRP